MTSSSLPSPAAGIDQGILQQIDQLQLSPRLKTERVEFFKREVVITSERAVLAMEWWQETEGDVLDVRWAKLVQQWAERLPIVIFTGQLVVGNETKLFRGVDPWVEFEAPNVLETMEKGRQMRTSAAVVSNYADEGLEAVEEAVHFFMGKSVQDFIFSYQRSLYGDWPEELGKVGGILRKGGSLASAPIPMWEKLFTGGLRGIIQEAEAGIEKVRSGEEPDAKKAWFWQAAIIVCDAVIHYARRYAQLARELAQEEPDPARRKELEQIAESCERVPEYPARTLQEAIQARLFWGLAIRWSRPNVVDHSGRVDQYLYPYFMSDLREHSLTLEQASDLVGSFLSNVSKRDGVKSVQRGEYAQGSLTSNVTLGGVTSEGQDANNELTYLILHMAGLLKYAEPHYTFRVNTITPKWVMLKALETNRKVGGGQPQFMSDDHLISYFMRQGETLEDARDWMGRG